MKTLIALFALAACGTPYQSMGWRGGYRDEEIDNEVYLVEVRVNGYTSGGRALSYLYRRAGELCPDGFTIVDGYSDVRTSYVRIGNTLQATRKPEIAAIIACNDLGYEEPDEDEE